MALERMKDCLSVTALAEELRVDRTVRYHWQRNMNPGEKGTGSTAHSPARELRKEVPDLKRVLAEKTLEVDFFKGALKKSRLDAGAAAALAGRRLRPEAGKIADAVILTADPLQSMPGRIKNRFQNSI